MKTLITEEYRKMQEELHRNPNYGVASVHYAPIVAEVAKLVGAAELLDYGAGKGRLGETLNTLMLHPPVIHHYDPARPEWSAPAEPCACVACIDVLSIVAAKGLGSGSTPARAVGKQGMLRRLPGQIFSFNR